MGKRGGRGGEEGGKRGGGESGETMLHLPETPFSLSGDCPVEGQCMLPMAGVLGGHSLCFGLPDAPNGGDGVLGQSSQSPPRLE